MKQQRHTGHATSMVKGLCIGMLSSMAVTIAAALIIAKLVAQEWIPWENIGYGIMAAILTASAIGGYISVRKIRHQRLIVCVLSGVIYWMLLFLISILLYRGKIESVPATTGIISIGAMCAFLMTIPRKKQSARKKYRSLNR